MNLVMIGTFREVRDADKAKRTIELISEQVSAESGGTSIRYSDEMLALLRAESINSVGPAELEQFLYDVKVASKGKQVVITTDETDISAFLKVLLERGAKIEVYSAHDYPEKA